LSPTVTPPEKRPDRHYNFGRMNMVFAWSALGLLVVTLWMVFADYAQPWKRHQAEFRNLERQKLQRETEEERRRIGEEQIGQLQADIQAAEKGLASKSREIEEVEKRISELGAEFYSADAEWRSAKAVLDEQRFLLDSAVQHGDEKAIAERRERVAAATQRLREAKAEQERTLGEKEAAQAQLAELRQGVTQAEERLAALRQGVENLETRMAGLSKDLDYFLLNAPLLDFVSPTLKVEQVILPGLVHDINFTRIDRVDRCMTCHVAANRPGFEGESWPEPYRSHPRLDLFVGDSSPHPYTRFGCTVCHGGLDRATDFARAGHSPLSEEQREEWKVRYKWETQPFLETPILPAGNSQAGCVTCHAGEAWTPQAEVQDTGRELITHMGCYGCHTIDYPAYQDLRKAGPALTRIAGKTNPAWAYRWIEAPREFHPTTWMPHFFNLENTRSEENRKRQQVEMAAIVSYLWERSEKPAYGQAPGGDAGRGQELFETVGCAGCHVVDRDAKREEFFAEIHRLHGPNLARTGSKVSAGWLYAWLKDPKQYFPETNMPNLRLTDQEAADLTAFLMSERDPAFENGRLPAVDAALRDELVTGYLQNLNTVERSRRILEGMSESQRNAYLGEQTITKYGCYGCHDIAGFEDAKPIGTELTQEGSKPIHQFDFGHVHDVPHTRQDWIRTKIMHPRIWDEGKEPVKTYNELLKMPDFGMTEREAEAVMTNVLGFTRETALATRRVGAGSDRTAALAEGRKLITRFNCQGCHLIEGQGHAIAGVIKDPAMLPPNLAAQGARAQGDWMFDYLHDPSQVEMRPWLTVRMPTFGFTDEQANAIIGYFQARDRRQPFSMPPVAAHPRDLAVGRVVFNMLQCAKCHPSGPEAAAATGVTPDLAPSLLLAGDRLRHDWVPSWIKDPQKWVPGTRMPSNFPETAPGQYMSPIAQAIASPTYAAQKAEMMRYFASEDELKEYLADVDRVTAALRDHIWNLSGGFRQPSTVASSGAPVASAPPPPAAGAVGAAGAGGRR
jgi:cytochrome c2/predicted  nucleic acid-binding Zn-ribbon protein